MRPVENAKKVLLCNQCKEIKAYRSSKNGNYCDSNCGINQPNGIIDGNMLLIQMGTIREIAAAYPRTNATAMLLILAFQSLRDNRAVLVRS